jgi:hypothetical protein
VPELIHLQNRKKQMHRARKEGLALTSLADLLHLASQYAHPMGLLMPPSDTQVEVTDVAHRIVQRANSLNGVQGKMIHVPMTCAEYNTEGLCLTGPVQIKWIGQLCEMPRRFVLHIDGKYKLHHGGWILITVGTHYLRWDAHHQQLSQSYVPLVYLMCKQGESGTAEILGSAHMVLHALKQVAAKFFEKPFDPGAAVADHAFAYRTAFAEAFPAATFLQCWPHLMGNYKKGEYAKKAWAHYDEVSGHLQGIHLAQSPQMRDLVMRRCGEQWDKWGHQMDGFWDSNCVEPWDCWSMGLTNTPLCTPNNNPQEAWHKQLALGRIPGMFRGSTEKVFMEALPQLVQLEGILRPTVLPFRVEVVPKQMLLKALWYVDHQDTHVSAFRDGAGDPAFYVLSKDNEYGAKKITPRLISMHEKAFRGEDDPRVKDLHSLLALAQCMHIVCVPEDGYDVMECEGNPASYECVACKSFKGVGICSHVLTINHMLKAFNVRYMLRSLETSASKKKKALAGNRTRQAKALERLPAPAPDSSDEEEERLQALALQGR